MDTTEQATALEAVWRDAHAVWPALVGFDLPPDAADRMGYIRRTIGRLATQAQLQAEMLACNYWRESGEDRADLRPQYQTVNARRKGARRLLTAVYAALAEVRT